MRYAISRTKATATGRYLPFVGLLLALALVFAASAQAQARFVYETCDSALPAGNPPPFTFHVKSGVAFEPFQTCAVPGGSIGVSETGSATTNPAYIETGMSKTPGGWVESLTITGSSGNFAEDTGHVLEESWPVPGIGDTTRYFLLRGEPPTGLEAASSGGVGFDIALACRSKCPAGAFVAAHFIAALEVDPIPPVIGTVAGPLVAGGVLRGHQVLQAQATDTGGGVRSLELRVNGMPEPGTAIGECSIAKVENPSYKGIVATSPTPCPPSLTDDWDVDTSAAPFQNGTNTVQVCASDFASTGLPNTTCSSPQTVEVDNSCTESPVPGGADLSAGFEDDESDELTVKYGSGAEVKGTLTDQAGDPIPGATICLESEPAGSVTVPQQTVATTTTDNAGNFGLKVGPGANRQFLVGYRHDSFQVAKKLSLATRARPSIKLDTHKIRGGRRFKITGTLPQPNPGGHVLVLQGSSAKGNDWLTFKKVTTGPEGNFGTTYRFTKPKRKTTFRIRAVVPAQEGYEYDPGASKAAQIRVRP